MLPPSTKHDFLSRLTEAEAAAKLLAAALLDGQPDRVAAAAQDMQQAASGLSRAFQVVQRGVGLEPALTHRLRRLGQGLAAQREACLRRAAVVDRALDSILPSSRGNTYSGAGTGPYGHQARRSGAFSLISA